MIGRNDARDYVAGMTDAELDEALSRQLSARVKVAALREVARRSYCDLAYEVRDKIGEAGR